MPDVLQLLRNDHEEVKDLFKRFEGTDDRQQKGLIAKKALVALEVHAAIEEEIFYPAVREEGDTDEMMNEAEEEHHVAHMLVSELMELDPSDERFDAKFTVLAENVKHHIDEEESEMLPKAAEVGMDRLRELGQEMEERKLELMGELQQMMDGGRRRTAAGRTNGRRATTRGRTATRTSTRGRVRSGTARKRTASPGRSTRTTVRARGTMAQTATPSRPGAKSRAGASARSTGRATSGRGRVAGARRGTRVRRVTGR